jgi:diadenosine tetraphosphate (Ap4A) HIT family hydrolase
MINDTIRKFGYPQTLVHEHPHWLVLLRPAQVTLGALVLAAKDEATAFGDLPPEAYAELAAVTKDIERTLLAEIGYQKINYLMLMMVDPHVHFHVIPRYEGVRTLEGVSAKDAGWPGPPDLKSAPSLGSADFERLQQRISKAWLTDC